MGGKTKYPHFHNHDGHNYDFVVKLFKQESIEGLYGGKPVTGENGLFTPLLKHFLESALKEEMDRYLVQTRRTE